MAEYIVDTVEDETDDNGRLSLREAVALANANPGADRIVFASGPGASRKPTCAIAQPALVRRSATKPRRVSAWSTRRARGTLATQTTAATVNDATYAASSGSILDTD